MEHQPALQFDLSAPEDCNALLDLEERLPGALDGRPRALRLLVTPTSRCR